MVGERDKEEFLILAHVTPTVVDILVYMCRVVPLQASLTENFPFLFKLTENVQDTLSSRNDSASDCIV